MAIDVLKALEIIKQRGALYGDPLAGHARLAKLWSIIIEEAWQLPLPKELTGHMVCLMMAALKLQRAARPAFDEDHYLDLLNYLSFASDMAPGRPVPKSLQNEELLLQQLGNLDQVSTVDESKRLTWTCKHCKTSFSRQSVYIEHTQICALRSV